MLQPNIENIMIALNEDSLSVSYYVAKDFYGYSDGIYDTSMCDGATRTSHAVVIVGYGTAAKSITGLSATHGVKNGAWVATSKCEKALTCALLKAHLELSMYDSGNEVDKNYG